MTRFQFDLATPEDDRGLRQLLADTPMPGKMSLTLQREPNFFAADRVFGDRVQTIVCRDTQNGTLVGMGTRSSRMRYINGVPSRVGYLGGLRFANHVRSGGLLARGFRYLKSLHDADSQRPSFYLTSIAESNSLANRMLTSRRAELPGYQKLQSLHTFVIPSRSRSRLRCGRHQRSLDRHDIRVRRLSNLPDTDPWFDFANRCGQRLQFCPVYQPSDLAPDSESVFLFERAGKIIATAGIWDQSEFRQTKVIRYQGVPSYLRPLINLYSKCSGGVRLPTPGNTVSAAYAWCLLVDEFDPSIFRLLIGLLISQCGRENLLLGLCDSSPYLSLASRMKSVVYRTNLFLVSWDDQSSINASVPAFIELGNL